MRTWTRMRRCLPVKQATPSVPRVVRSETQVLSASVSGSSERFSGQARTPGTRDRAIQPEAARFRSWATRAPVLAPEPLVLEQRLLRRPGSEHPPAEAGAEAAFRPLT